MSESTLHVITPTFKPVGGVVKIFDYVQHARHHGWKVSVRAPTAPTAEMPLFNIERFVGILSDVDIEFHSNERLALRGDDFVFFSLPPDFEIAYNSLPAGYSPERVIHIIQNVRHTNPHWLRGYPLRLLSRPMARISTNAVVATTVEPYLDKRCTHEIINLGHEQGYFEVDRGDAGFRSPIRVASTTWKSDVGERVAGLVDPEHFEFRFIGHAATWSELRDLYMWADVFLGAPNQEEGFYMPDFEAMEAGCIVVTPDAGGNMAFCQPGKNCVMVEFDDAASYAAALRKIAKFDIETVATYRRSGLESMATFTLDGERADFGTFLTSLRTRLST